MSLDRDQQGIGIQAMPYNQPLSISGNTDLDVGNYCLIVFDADVNIGTSPNTYTWPANKELVVTNIDTLPVTGTANYMVN